MSGTLPCQDLATFGDVGDMSATCGAKLGGESKLVSLIHLSLDATSLTLRTTNCLNLLII